MYGKRVFKQKTKSILLFGHNVKNNNLNDLKVSRSH